nr:MAG TPA: hypothetical protein [Caudoviricetes sp.]
MQFITDLLFNNFMNNSPSPSKIPQYGTHLHFALYIVYYKCRWRFYLHVIIVVILFIRVLTDCLKSVTSHLLGIKSINK